MDHHAVSPYRRGTAGQVDVVVAHLEHGFGVVEVKGGPIQQLRTENGAVRTETGRNPVEQLLHNRYAVRDHLRTVLPHVEVDAALAFPLVGGVEVAQITDIGSHQLIWSHDLETIEKSLLQIMTRGTKGRPMYTEDTLPNSSTLRPTVHFNQTQSARRIAIEKLNDRTIEQLRALERLDRNRKVFVSGGAGSGKVVSQLVGLNEHFSGTNVCSRASTIRSGTNLKPDSGIVMESL